MAAIDTHFEAEVQPWGDASGLHLALQFKNRRFNAEFFKACRAHGIYVQSVQQYCTEAVRHDDKLLLGYGHLQKENIIEGIAALNKIIRQCP
jgi:GntR family transcriptional regulator/MocR family aminotransferase